MSLQRDNYTSTGLLPERKHWQTFRLPVFFNPSDFINARLLWNYKVGLTIRRRNAFLVLFLLLLGILLCVILWIRRKQVQKFGQPKLLPLDVIQALSTVFTPTSMAWPSSFAFYFKASNESISKTGKHRWMELDLSELIHHICAGEIELRNYDDLASLFRGGLRVYGWRFKLHLGRRWWIKTAKWLAEQHLGHPQLFGQTSTSDFLAFWPVGYTSATLRLRPSLDLDFAPYDSIGAEIRHIQDSHQHGTRMTIEFTSLDCGIRFMAPEFLLCAIPFLRCLGAPPENINKGRYMRTSTPLFVQLQDIIALLSSAGSSSIHTITNISIEHSNYLRKLEQELVVDRNLRKERIKTVGVDGWRQERLMLAWEAGLLRAGLLNRWRIILSK